MDPATLAQLRLAKLRALITPHWGEPSASAAVHPPAGGAAIADGERGWCLVEAAPERALGGALAWAHRAGVTELHVIVNDAVAAGHLARRAGGFTSAPQVWWIEGTEVVAAEALPLPPVLPIVGDVTEFVRLFDEVGAEPVVEHGILRAEVLGLEVARVVDEAGVPFLEVGVGRHDREAHREMEADSAPRAALERVIAGVRAHRVGGALSHPANTLSRERWLRRIVIDQPALVGAASLEAVESPVRRTDLRVAAPAPAAGVDADGAPVLVVCSTGIDLDLVPAAWDARLRDARARARLVLAVPPGDDHPLTLALAASMVEPAEVRVVEWPVA
ncbi:MAG TPA: hypothetical protein VMY34_06400 [Acidimicrobiales bacterium]|nr:hypothetical protein [Acidimicrobiales bacterium]